MNASKKITIIITTVFLGVFLVLASLLYSQAVADIEEESRASLLLANALTEQAYTPAQLKYILAASRHLDVHHHSPAQTTAEDMFNLLVTERNVDLDKGEITLIYQDGQQLSIRSTEDQELEEVLNTVYVVFVMFLVALTLTLFSVRYAVNTRLRALKQLSDGIDSLKDGNYQVTVEGNDIQEIDDLMAHFNALGTALNEHEDSLQQLQQTLLRVQEDERQRLALELHDNIGQMVTGIKIQTYMLSQLPDTSAEQRTTISLLQEQASTIQRSLKHLTTHLHPLILENVSLSAGLEQLCNTSFAATTVQGFFTCQSKPFDEQVWSLESKTHIYRIVQEAIHNILKHAQATQAHVTITDDNKQFHINITDDGQGFSLNRNHPSLGLFSMHYRAKIIGGTCVIDSQTKGTKVNITLPKQHVTTDIDEAS
jgi:two-component system sensor histidine kinase UhpB